MAMSGYEREKQMAFVRVKLTSIDDGWTDYPVTVDLKIDDERRSVVNWPLFGAMGIQAKDYWLFRMDTNGGIDFGTPGELRNAWMNLLEKEIRPNETCTYRESPGDPEVVYRTEDITPL